MRFNFQEAIAQFVSSRASFNDDDSFLFENHSNQIPQNGIVPDTIDSTPPNKIEPRARPVVPGSKNPRHWGLDIMTNWIEFEMSTLVDRDPLS